MRKFIRASFVFAFGLLASCSNNIPMTADSIQSNVIVKDDPYLKMRIIEAPRIGNILDTNYRLTRGIRDGLVVDQIFVDYAAENWAFLNSAHDIDGRALNVSSAGRDVEPDATISEMISVELPPGYLEKHADMGLNIRIDGQKGEMLVVIPPPYVQGFLAATGHFKQPANVTQSPAGATAPPSGSSPPSGLLESSARAPVLGIRVTPVTENISPVLMLDKPRGLYVIGIDPNGPAANAGMRVGDVILSFNGQNLMTLEQLRQVLAKTSPGSSAHIEVWHLMKKTTLTVSL